MKKQLEEFENILNKLYPNFVINFNAGMSEGDINQIITVNKLSLSNSLKDLYMWRNGIDIPENSDILEQMIFPNGILFSLEEAIKHYKICALEEKVWDEEFFPIFSSSYGDYVLIKQKTATPFDEFLYIFSPALLVVEPTTIYDSLKTLIYSLEEGYKKGIIRRENGLLIRDNKSYYDFMKGRNPQSEYWKMEY